MSKKRRNIVLIVVYSIVLIMIILLLNNFIFGKKEEKISSIVDNNSNKTNVIMNIVSDLDYAINITDKKTRNDNVDYIIIGTVKKIDGSTNYNKARDIYTQVMTTGKIEVKKVIKGDIKSSEISFQRLGGTLSFAEYEKGLREEQKRKIELYSELTQEEKEYLYVKYSAEGDIEIEEGKTYLMYLDYDSDYNGYSFRFLEYGLREVKDNNGENLVLNNQTREWEDLSKVL